MAHQEQSQEVLPVEMTCVALHRVVRPEEAPGLEPKLEPELEEALKPELAEQGPPWA